MNDAKKTKAQLIRELADLRQSEARYRNFFENVADACFEMDLRGHLTFLNQKAGDVFGYRAENAVGLSHRIYTSPETAENALRVFSGIYRTGEPATILNYEIIRPDGETRHLDLSATLIRDETGRPVGFRGITRDVTEIRQIFREQKRSKIFLDNVEDACWELNLEGDTIFCNEATWRRVGCTREEILAPGYRKRAMLPEDYEIMQKHFEEIYRTGLPKTGVKTRICHKNGSLQHIEMSISLIRDQDGNPTGFRGISHDVTEQERAEEEQIRFRNFLDNMEDCCFEIDLEGRYLYLNEVHHKITGYTVEELRTMTYRDFVKTKDVSDVFDCISRTGEPVKALVFEIIRKGGQIRIMEMSATPIRDVAGKIIGTRGMVRDVTDREKTHEERKRFQEFMESVEDACFETDLKGHFTYVNEAECKTLGYSFAELQSIRYDDYSPPEEAKKVSRAFGRLFRTGEPLTALKHGIIRKDGQARTLEVSATAIRNGSGNIIGTRGISRDVTERERTYEAGKRFQEFMENVADGCFETDLEGRYIYLNEAQCKIFGYSADDLNGKTYKDFSSPEVAKKISEAYERMFQTGEPITALVRNFVRKDGQLGIMETSATPIRDSTGKIIGARGISRDVTDRKKLEAEQERYRVFLESVEDACWETNLMGEITFCNEATWRQLGYTREEYLQSGKQRVNWMTPEAYREIMASFLAMYKTGNPVTSKVFPYFHKDGHTVFLEISASIMRDKSGKAIGARGISRDVTERKKAEMEQERYRVFLENVDDGCWELDLAGQVTFCNEAAGRKLGYTKEEYMQAQRDTRMPPDAHAEMTRLFKELYRTGHPISGKVFPYFHKGGGTVFMEVSLSVMRDETGKAVGARGISRDVTERKKMEEQLTQAQKLEAIGTLAGGIAHDFNNLLMGIQGFTSLMLLDTDSYHPNYEKLKGIEAQVQNAAELTRQLLGYARGGRYEVKPTDMNALIDQTATLFGRTKRELRIHKNFTAGLWPVEVDRGQMDQSLLNIMINAWQAMPGGGSLYLTTENVMLDEAYVTTYDVPAGPYVKITITDTGVGMDEQTRQRIFDPFFTTKGMGRGSGLGMASVYGIIRGHHGIVNVYSEKGHGTTFTIYLPSSRKEAVVPKRPLPETTGEQKTILLADDEAVITDVTSAMLRGLGYSVLIAGSGEEAIELYRIHQEKIDVVIMDMIMPGLGGGAAIDRIHAIHPEARIILSSGYSLNGEAQDIMDRGGSRAFLQKPFLMDELAQKIKEILAI